MTQKAHKPTHEENPWVELGLEPRLVTAVARAKFSAPTDIQRELIPVALAGHDCLGQARTGTGKTAAFALPMLQRLTPGKGLQAIVLAPTRELAAQVDEHVRQLRGDKALNTVVVLGGRRLKDQIEVLRRKPEIAIGTPGRVLDLMQRKELNIAHVKLAILDEVDRMLDIGFRDDIRRILKTIEGPHQTIFVSATIDEPIRRLAKPFMDNPIEINVSREILTVEGVHAGFVSVHPNDKMDTLLGFVREEKPRLSIVFTNTKHKARRVALNLKKAGIECKELHGDLTQDKRERVMRSFRKQHIQVLVATDLASRGLDVMDISHIVNFDVPQDAAGYVHRIGRTARMGKTGYAVMLVTPDEGKALTEIEKLINKEIPQWDPQWLVTRNRRARPTSTAAPTAPEHAVEQAVAVPPPQEDIAPELAAPEPAGAGEEAEPRQGGRRGRRGRGAARGEGGARGKSAEHGDRARPERTEGDKAKGREARPSEGRRGERGERPPRDGRGPRREQAEDTGRVAAQARPAAPVPAPPDMPSEGDHAAVPQRLLDPRRRDEVLEAYGLQPVKRTLGSRFRSARKFRR